MHVDVRDTPGSSILAIVVTLVLVALLSFSLRLYSRGRRLRNLGTDDWLLAIAALCTVGTLVITVYLKGDLEKQAWPTATDEDRPTSILVWVFTLLHIVGVGFIKLSATRSLFQLALRTWYRHTILGFICLTTILIVLWFGSVLLFCGPATVNWSSTSGPEATCRVLGFSNNILDVATDLLVILLPTPILLSLSPSPAFGILLLVVVASALTATTAAAIRTYVLYDTWKGNDRDDHVSFVVLWSTIELTAGMIAACLPALKPLASLISQLFHQHLRGKDTPTTSSLPSPQYHSHNYASTETVIHRPNTPHLLSLRFHDDESNLDFDIEPPNTRTRTQTLRSQDTHSRNVSDWSQFSGFTYYTTTANSVQEASPRRSRVVSMDEMGVRTRPIGVGRSGGGSANIGVAVTTLHDKPVRESEAGEEMAELARLFADDGKNWGTTMSHSIGTSVTTVRSH